MPKLLRNEFLKNISLDLPRLNQINAVLKDIAINTNGTLKSQGKAQETLVLHSYVIRYDNKGFLLNDFSTVLKHYENSQKIERIVFYLVSDESTSSNLIRGKNIELKLDANDPNNCSLAVQDDDTYWVDSSFTKIMEKLNEFKNKHYLIRNNFTVFIVQISGVLIGFFLSLWIAKKVSPLLSLEYPFTISFILSFLLFANAWTFLNPQIINILNYRFPNILLKTSKFVYLTQSILVATFVSVFLAVSSKVLTLAYQLLKSFLK